MLGLSNYRNDSDDDDYDDDYDYDDDGNLRHAHITIEKVYEDLSRKNCLFQ